MTEETCSNCHFSRQLEGDLKYYYYCRRNAPVPHTFLLYYKLELLRWIAYAQHAQANLEEAEVGDDLNTEATEAMKDASWPKVVNTDWCGEWRLK